MKRMKLLGSILLAAFVLYQGAAYAQSISGKVLSTDAIAKSLTIGQTNPATGAEEEAVVWVTDTTTYSGSDSLEGLKAGDEVSVVADEDPTTKNWMATSIQRLEAPAPAPAPAATQ